MPVVRLLNNSKRLTDVQLGLIAAAVSRQVTDDLAPAWGLDPLTIRVTSGSYDQKPDDWLMRFDDNTAQGALGWHTDGKVPYSWVGVEEILSYGGQVLVGISSDGRPAVSSVASHEACEMLIDPLATLYEPQADGSAFPLEVCDPFQALSYRIGGVDVSDFCLPSLFLTSSVGATTNGTGTGATDKLASGLAPGKIASGGYVALRNPDGSTTQVNAERPPQGYWKVRASRSRRRPYTFKRKPPPMPTHP